MSDGNAGPTAVNRTARLAGALHLSLVPFGVFSFVYVPSVLVVRGDAAATARNIEASEWLFRAATVSHLISQIIVVFLARAFYRLFAPVNRDRAVLMVVLVLLGVSISCLTEVNHLAALRILDAGGGGDNVMLFLDMHRDGIAIAQVFWGLWLLVLSSLVFKSGFLPKALGVSVAIGAAGYLIDSSVQLLSPGVPTISQLTFIGELLLPLWLLIKGVRRSNAPDSGRA